MSWKTCFFEPIDVITNADFRPMDIGGVDIGTTLQPQAFAGALKTLILSEAQYDLTKPIEELAEQQSAAKDAAAFVGVPEAPDVEERLALTGLFEEAATDSRLFLRAPSPIWDAERTLVAPAESGRLCDSALRDDGLRLLQRPEPGASPRPWLCEFGYLCKRLGRLGAAARTRVTGRGALKLQEAFYGVERRVGHMRSAVGGVEEGCLVEKSVVRREEGTRQGRFVMFAKMNGRSVQEGSMVRVGGDGHMARVTVEDASIRLAPATELVEIVKESIEANPALGISLVLTGPAVFTDGWKPPIDPELHGVRLCAAAVGRPLPIGGWDLARRSPRAMRWACGPGTMYFYEVQSPDKALAWLNKATPFLCLDTDDALFGLGSALPGVWDPSTGELI